MSNHDIEALMALGITPDEIWCAIAEPGPWTIETMRVES